MFKGKKAIYVLIPINILVWGFFIYRFYTAFNDFDTQDVSDKINPIKLENLKDTIHYKLNLDYKDPFLKDVEKEKKYNKGSTNTNNQKQPEKIIAVITPSVTSKQLPDIKYFGLIKNNTSGAATALISLNGQSKHVKLNDVIDGVTFKSFNKDSIVAKCGKVRIVVGKL